MNEVAEVSIRGLDGTIMTFIAYVLEDLESQFIIGADQLSQLIGKSLKTPIGEFFVGIEGITEKAGVFEFRQEFDDKEV